MRKRDITRIQYKLSDMKEYEAMKDAKLKEGRADKSANDTLTTPVTKTKTEKINQRIGIEPMD